MNQIVTTPEDQKQGENKITWMARQIMSDTMSKQLDMALPSHISVKKYQRIIITAINKNPDLVECDILSLLTACIECAQDGLVPDGKEAALVAYNTNVAGKNQPKKWVKKVQYMPMIKGICKKAYNSGELPFLDAHVVHENDDFDYQLGLHPDLVHKPKLGERGEFIGAYAVAITKDGSNYIEVMSKAEIESIRLESSKSQDDKGDPYGPWKNYYGEMARKTALRRLSKRLPLSSELSRVIERIDAMHTFENQPDAVAVEVPPRPKPEDFEQKKPATVKMIPLIDEYGNHDGDFSPDDYVAETVKRIGEFDMAARLEDFWDFNADGREMLGVRTDASEAVASAYNEKRRDLAADAEGPDADPEPQDEGTPEQ